MDDSLLAPTTLAYFDESDTVANHSIQNLRAHGSIQQSEDQFGTQAFSIRSLIPDSWLNVVIHGSGV